MLFVQPISYVSIILGMKSHDIRAVPNKGAKGDKFLDAFFQHYRFELLLYPVFWQNVSDKYEFAVWRITV